MKLKSTTPHRSRSAWGWPPSHASSGPRPATYSIVRIDRVDASSTTAGMTISSLPA